MKNKIRELRKTFGYTQEEISSAVGVSRQTINAIENGKYSPSLELAFRLARLLHTTVEGLFLFDE